MNILKNKYLILMLRIILSLVFIFSGIEKIINPELFSDSISNYRLFPSFSINLIAITIPWIELTVGLLLLFGISVKDNIIIINSLLMFFVVIILIAVIRGLDIDCGCYGSSSQKVGFLKIIENVILFIFGIILYNFGENNFVLSDKYLAEK